MKIDETTIGLSLVLAALVALTVFSASFPAIADPVTQEASVTKNITAIDFMNQTGVSSITGWTFSGVSGTTVQPQNSNTEDQEAGTNNKAVSRLKNTDSSSMDVYLYSAEFNATAVATVSNERMNVTASGENVTIAQLTGTITTTCPATATTTIVGSGTKDLWLKLTLGQSGAAEATFHADCEVS